MHHRGLIINAETAIDKAFSAVSLVTFNLFNTKVRSGPREALCTFNIDKKILRVAPALRATFFLQRNFWVIWTWAELHVSLHCLAMLLCNICLTLPTSQVLPCIQMLFINVFATSYVSFTNGVLVNVLGFLSYFRHVFPVWHTLFTGHFSVVLRRAPSHERR